MLLKMARLAVATAAAALLAAVFAVDMLENTFVNYPRSPDPIGGRVVSHAVKGITVYISERQLVLLTWLTWIEIGAAAIVVLVVVVHRGDLFNSLRK
jgi:hypothetical protein